MKAAVLNKYDKKGTDLEVSDIPVPEIGADDVLVKIRYAGVNPLDNMIIREEVKLITPYKVPLVMGNEFSGVVEKVGSNVSEFKEGDSVYARMPLDKIGAFAEFTAIDKNALAKIPEFLDFKQAACVPLTALTAFQSFELMNAKKGDSYFVCHVITSGSARNEERVKSLGVDEFFDYRTQDYASELSDIDFVLDTVGESELEKEFAILKEGGILVSLKGLPNAEFASRMGLGAAKKMLFKVAGMKFDRMAKKKNQKYYFLFVESDGSQLSKIEDIFQDKPLETSVDEIYSLEDVNRALRKVQNGGSKGKTLIEMP